ncbi:MAG: DUF3536 domain-containing protein [Hydrogenobaculum sp.]
MQAHKYFVVHGHFYQPIRINPSVGEIDLEPSAYPYENWNKRILRECYLPNVYAHIKEDDLVVDIVNNYENISFNVGYTLLSWFEKHAPYLLDVLKKSSKNALAISFNHTILPLDPRFDKEIQVYWGIKTHERYFGVKPKGMWLPECAVDYETLEVLKTFGIEYVILAPHQVHNKTSKNYGYIRLKNGNIKVFIYDGIISAKLSFEDLLTDVKRLADTFRQSGDVVPIVATDGETFGHHKKFGEMGLAYLSKLIPLKALNDLVEELKDFDYEFKLVENTSWSCPHGIERWRTHCGCNSGAHPDWNQYWRGPLREALEFLRRKVKENLENIAKKFKIDVKQLLFEYVDVILGVKDVEEFLKEKGIDDEEYKLAFAKLLNAYKCVQFSFSSDAWFFDDVSGVEVKHCLDMAKYAIYLLKDYEDIEIPFINILQNAKGNTAQRPTAKDVYIKDAKVYTLEDVASYLAIMNRYGYIKDDGYFIKFYYEISAAGNYIYVFLKDKESLEKNSFEFNVKDLDVSNMFGAFKKDITEFLIYNTVKENIQYYEELIKQIISKISRIEAISPFLEQQKAFIEQIAKNVLLYMLKQNYGIENIVSFYSELVNFGVSLKSAYITKEAGKYLYRKAKELPNNEDEFLKILSFVKLYNKDEKDYALMIGIWETQNEVWAKKDLIKNKSILDALHIAY